MKILFISYIYWPPDFGGALLHIIERLESLAERGNQICVLTSGAEGFDLFEKKAGFIIHRSGYSKKGNILEKTFHRLFFLIWVLIQLQKEDYEIVHMGSLPGIDKFTFALCGLLFLSVIHRRKAKAVYLYSLAESESTIINLKGASGFFFGSFLKNLDAVVINSTGLYKGMQSVCGSKTRMILNGVRDDVFFQDQQIRELIRKENGLTDEIVFTFIGSLEKRKGVDILLNAYESVIQKNPNVRLWIIGPFDKKSNQNIDERESSSLLKKAKALPDVTCWGRINERTELNRLLNASDVFVFPTRREGMPMAPLQAMACGVPVIISKIPGVTDLANIDQVTGLFIPVGDVEALGSVMLKLAESPELRVRMSEAAVKRIHGFFSWQKHVTEWEKLYQNLSTESSRP